MFNQAQSQLPYSPEQMQRPFLNISPNNPPFVPNYQGDQFLMQMTPFIAGATAVEIQNSAQKNPLRMFMFNQYSENNFMNAAFNTLVIGVMDYIALCLAQGRYQNPEQAAQEAVPAMCEMACALSLRQFPQLEQYLTQDMAQRVRNSISQFDNLSNQIQMMKNRMGGGAYQPQGQFGGSQWQNMGGYNQPRAGFSRNPTGPGFTTTVAPEVGAAVFRAGQTNVGVGPVAGTRIIGGGGKYSQQAPDESVVKQPFTARQPTAAQIDEAQIVDVTEPEEVPATSGKIKWRPSPSYPYFPAYNPEKAELFFKKEADGTVVPILKERNVAVMDYDRHGTSFGPVPRMLELNDTARTLALIEQGVKELNKAVGEAATDGEEAEKKLTTYVKREFIAETCISAAWFNGSLERLTTPDGKMPDVFRVYARITDPIIGEKDESDAVKNFGSSKTYIELREKLDASVNEISPKLWATANGKMTRLVNRVIRQNLSIPGLEIESFVADIQDLIDILGNKYGDVVQNSFLKHARENIASAFQLLYEDIAKGMTQDFLADRQFPNDAVPQFTYLASDYSLTYLNCWSYELGVQLADGIASAITPTALPLLHELLDGLFKDVDANPAQFERHLITTNDGRVLEATRGYIGQDFYLLTLLPEEDC